MAFDYKPITGRFLGIIENRAAIPAGADSDFFYLIQDDGDAKAGVYRVNDDGTSVRYGGISGELSASLATINAQVAAVKGLIGSSASTSTSALESAVKTLQDSIKSATGQVAADLANSKTAFDSSIATMNGAVASAIAEWDTKRVYKTTNIVMRDKTFFISLVDGNVGKDPLADNTGAWSIFTPGSATDVFANRSPTGTDVRPIGVKWWDTSFSSASPLGFVSRGGGSWVYINAIQLRAIRFHVKTQISSFSVLNSIRIFDKDGVQIPYNHFVIGARSSGFGAPVAGTPYSGQGMWQDNNSNQWVELEPAASLDLSRGISKMVANYRTDKPSTGIDGTELRFNSGAVKYFSGTGPRAASDVVFMTSDPPVAMQYGSNVDSAQGPALIAAQLANSEELTYGRVCGKEFVSAVMQLIAPLEARVKALEPVTPPVDPNAVTFTFVQEGAEFVASMASATGKTIQTGSVSFLLNQSSPTLRQVSQGGGLTSTVRHLYPTDPGNYNLQVNGRYTDGESFQFRHDFTV